MKGPASKTTALAAALLTSGCGVNKEMQELRALHQRATSSISVEGVELHAASEEFRPRFEASAQLSSVHQAIGLCEERYQRSLQSPLTRTLAAGSSEQVHQALFSEYITPTEPAIKKLSELLVGTEDSAEIKAQKYLSWIRTEIAVDKHEQALGDWYRTPLETVYEGLGDCEDQSFLFASLCQAQSIDVVLIRQAQHVLPAVSGDFEGFYCVHRAERFYFADPLHPEGSVGHRVSPNPAWILETQDQRPKILRGEGIGESVDKDQRSLHKEKSI